MPCVSPPCSLGGSGTATAGEVGQAGAPATLLVSAREADRAGNQGVLHCAKLALVRVGVIVQQWTNSSRTRRLADEREESDELNEDGLEDDDENQYGSEVEVVSEEAAERRDATVQAEG